MNIAGPWDVLKIPFAEAARLASRSKSSCYRLHRVPPLQKKQRWGILGCGCSGKSGPAPGSDALCVRIKILSLPAASRPTFAKEAKVGHPRLWWFRRRRAKPPVISPWRPHRCPLAHKLLDLIVSNGVQERNALKKRADSIFETYGS